MHRPAGRRGLLDDHGVGRPEVREGLEQQLLGDALVLGLHPPDRRSRRRERAFRRRRPREQGAHPVAHAGDDRGAGRRPRRVRRVLGELDQRRALGHRGVALHRTLGVEREHRGTEHQDEVVLAQRRPDAVVRGREEAAEEPVALGEPAARRHRGDVHPGGVPLGEGDDVVEGAVTVHLAADDERGRARRGQAVRDVGERVGVARHRGDDAVGGHVAGGPVPVVDRHRHEHRPARRRGRHVDRAGQGGRHVGGPGRLAGELHVGLAELGRALGEQERLPHQQRPRLLARDDHQGRAVAEGGEDVPQPVAHPGRRVQVHQTRTAGGLREPVGHGDRHRLLQREGVAEVVREVPEHRQLRGARVPEDRRDAVLAQHRERGLPDRGHGSSTRSPARYSWYAARSSRPWPQ